MQTLSSFSLSTKRAHLRPTDLTQRHILTSDEAVEQLLLLLVPLIERLLCRSGGHLLVGRLRGAGSGGSGNLLDEGPCLERAVSLVRGRGPRDRYGLGRHQRRDHVQVLKLLSNDSLRQVDGKLTLLDVVDRLLASILHDFVREREPERQNRGAERVLP